jgi:hypothetical protein
VSWSSAALRGVSRAGFVLRRAQAKLARDRGMLAHDQRRRD